MPTVTKKEEESVQKNVNETLKAIINDWYENVASFYVTKERLAAESDLHQEEELKRFHDKNGYRIKFHKGDLDFTYGLKSYWQGTDFVIEVSVNNKVENFDYDTFRDRLFTHYTRKGGEKVPTPYELRSHSYREIFQLEPNLEKAFSVERRANKADIMRLSFRVKKEFLDRLVLHPLANRQLLESFCVSPFRSVYATVYRRSAQ